MMGQDEAKRERRRPTQTPEGERKKIEPPKRRKDAPKPKDKPKKDQG